MAIKISNNTVIDDSRNIFISSANNGCLAGFRNRIINGTMVIDQRFGGAQATSAQGMTVDRWLVNSGGGALFNVQRETSIVPTGQAVSLRITVGTADASIAATDFGQLWYGIEGFDVVDLSWGTASAIPVTISFWVRSSVTGTYAASVHNSGGTRSYVYTYTVNVANTWERKTATIPGDTTGTWLIDNGIGINLRWDLGCGSSFQTTAGSWVGTTLFTCTASSIKLSSTAGANFYITGVQFEAGTIATPFESRSVHLELDMCQRYYQALAVRPSVRASEFDSQAGVNWGRFRFTLPTNMRVVPTITTSGNFTATPNNAVGPYYSLAPTAAGAPDGQSGFVQLTYNDGKIIDTAGTSWLWPTIRANAEFV